MSQSRIASAIEANTNAFVGYWLSVVVGQFLYPAMGWDANIAENMTVTFVFYLVSTTRAYFMRRLFNWWQNRNPRRT